jgi:hypothetical protein
MADAPHACDFPENGAFMKVIAAHQEKIRSVERNLCRGFRQK